MKTLAFNYTKKDGSTSERYILATGMPSDKISGIDMSELDPNMAAEFVARANELHSEYVESLRALQREYDLTHNYRQFFESKASNLHEI